MRKKLFFGVYNPSIILTYISAFSAIVGMLNLMKSETIQSFDYMRVAIPLLIISGICDMFDGAVARMCKRTEVEKEFGIQLDSLADTVAFVVFPALMVMHMSNYSSLSAGIACFYTFAGIMRLGWFNVTTEENKGYFQGLPVTMSALIIPLVYTALHAFSISGNLFIGIMQLTFLMTGFLFIANFKFKKPDTKKRIALIGVAVAIFVALFFV